MNADSPAKSLRLRIIVETPPPGVRFAVQKERSDLLDPVTDDVARPTFEVVLRLGQTRPDGGFNFLGDFAQGPPAERFVYLNAGTLAGQPASPWTRRAKLMLASIPRPIVEAAIARRNAVVEARVQGTMADGGPICAAVKPHAVTWRLLPQTDRTHDD